MTISKRWIQRSVLCGLLLGGVVGCSMVTSPPVGQIAQNDHAALAAWYDKEAANLRERAKSMAEMEVVYRKSPGYAQGMMGTGKTISIRQHCQALVGMYTKAAEEADELAKGHRGMMK